MSRQFVSRGIRAISGWAIQYFRPPRQRLAFLVLLALFGLELVFGLREDRWSAEGFTQVAWPWAPDWATNDRSIIRSSGTNRQLCLIIQPFLDGLGYIACGKDIPDRRVRRRF